MVSVFRIRPDSPKSARPFKGIVCADVSEFESYHVTHAVSAHRARIATIAPTFRKLTRCRANAAGPWIIRTFADARIVYRRPHCLTTLPITVGRMTAEHGKLRAEIVELSVER
jgi:hypothetical protein